MQHFTAFFGGKKLSDLTPWHLEQYKKARKDAGMLPSTINIELAVLNAMLHRAQIWGKLGEHPGKEVKRLKGVQGKTRFLSESEEEAILAACAPPLQRLVSIGLLTGFRRKELISLRPEDVDFDLGTVTVAALYSKNGESRTLPMGPRLKALLQEAMAAGGNEQTVLTREGEIPWNG